MPLNQEQTSRPPLVSCIMPTYGRADYVAESIEMYLAQDYPEKELIILNDCPGQILEGSFPGVRIVNSPFRWEHLGDKRNAAIELAKGEYIAVWDDDDVYLPWRLSHSMEQIVRDSMPFYCAAEYWAYWGEEKLEDNAAVSGWIWHPSFIFRKDDWKAVGGYPARTLGEDSVFLERLVQHRSVPWIPCPIPKADRFLIMRGRSRYHHTSIAGGSHPPDASPGTISMQPCEIKDQVLQRSQKILIRRKDEFMSRRDAVKQRSNLWPRVSIDAARFRLNELTPISCEVGYGEPGFHGELGYEGKRVEVNGEFRPKSLSTHAPARIMYSLEAACEFFCCEVALNDDVPPDASAADFLVIADGKLCGIARNVRSGQIPRILQAEIRGAREIELIVQPHQWDSCHSVWLDPFLVKTSHSFSSRVFIDGLSRAQITVPEVIPRTELCIATVGSRGFENWIDDLLGSICANAQCPNSLLVIFSFDDSEEIRRVAEKYEAVVVPCLALSSINLAVKSVLYSVSRVVVAEKFICLDADMLVLEDLRPIVTAIDAAPPGAILVCREAKWAADLGNAVQSIYGGQEEDLNCLIGQSASREARYRLVVNDGILAGSAMAFSALDDQIRGLNRPKEWLNDATPGIPWRNQCLLNLALAQAESGVELDPRYNVQLQSQPITVDVSCPSLAVNSRGRQAAVIHFNGAGRTHHPELRRRFSSVAKPLTRQAACDHSYEVFLIALRRWLGTLGRDALAWSFYGLPDGSTGTKCNASEFTLFAALHSLIRSNGCRRVIETGTARGISAACLACAVSQWPGSKVVTVDIGVWPERESLWLNLPSSARECIEPRQEDAITCLREAVENRETYDAALLDSVHTTEHVLQEFEFARQLVCSGGLILVHDAIWKPGSVGEALREIERMGYGVVRLWTAENSQSEDGGLGLAVIGNRHRSLT